MTDEISTPNLTDFENDLKILVACFLDLIAFINEPGQGVETCLGEALGLPFKMLHHVGSVLTLLEGTDVLDGSGKYLDHPSLSTLCRAAWEASVLFSYVAAPGESDEERRLRVDTWKHASIERRLDMSAIASNKAALDDAQSARTSVLAELEGNPAFTAKSNKQKKKLLDKYRWRPGWSKLAEDAGIAPKFGKDHYSVLCEQAHSGYLSVLGLTSPPTEEEDIQLKSVALGLLCAATVLAIETFIQAEPNLMKRRTTHPKWYAIYDAWIEGVKLQAPSTVHDL